ncbi:hypothetical protein ACQKWADRAFT_290578 [Trichoderma austrokoningii]
MESLISLKFDSPDKARAAIDAIALPLGISLVICYRKPNFVKYRCSNGKKNSSHGAKFVYKQRSRCSTVPSHKIRFFRELFIRMRELDRRSF